MAVRGHKTGEYGVPGRGGRRVLSRWFVIHHHSLVALFSVKSAQRVHVFHNNLAGMDLLIDLHKRLGVSHKFRLHLTQRVLTELAPQAV